MRRYHAVPALFLAAVLLFSGCGAVQEPGPAQSGAEPAPAVTETEELVSAMTLSSEPLPGGMSELGSMYAAADSVCLAGLTESGSPRLGMLDGTGEYTALELPADVTEVSAVFLSDGGVRALAATGDGLCLLAYGPDGSGPERTPLSGELLAELSGSLEYCELDGVGYIRSSACVAELSPEGEVTRTAVPEAGSDYLVSMQEAGGKLYVLSLYALGGGSPLFELDRETMTLLPADAQGMTLSGLGLGADGSLLLNGAMDGLKCVCKLTDEGPEELFAWAETGIVGPDYSLISERQDGSYLLFTPYMDSLQSVSEQLVKQKEVLTLLADFAAPSLYPLVNSFNRSSEDYRIEVSNMNETGMSMELLQAELISGNGPDIFAFTDRNVLSAMNANAFVDLLPFLDADEEYGRETLVPGLLAALSADGCLRWLPQSFSISTFTAPSDYVAEPGLSYEEAEAAAASAGLPLFPGWMTQDIIWDWLSRFAAGQYVDAEAGTCDFLSEDYITLLERCAATSTEFGTDYDALYNGFLQFEPLQNLVRLAVISENYGGAYTFAGAPNETTNGSMYSPGLSLAISAQSEHAETAWQFVRSVLSAENQPDASSAFPSNAAALDAALLEMQETGLDFYGTVYRLTEEDVQKFRELLDGTTTVQDAMPAVKSIMDEEASQYFSGQISAQQAAERTQNRVSLYLSEQS